MAEITFDINLTAVKVIFWSKSIKNPETLDGMVYRDPEIGPDVLRMQQIEKSSDWHKAVQGLFGIGLIILLVGIVTISCNICCCRCCKESMAIATACGVLTVIGLFVILVSLAVYGAFAYMELGVGLTGPKIRFFWGFYLSIAAAGLAIIPAILFICDGRREILPEHEDCETAKMV